MTARQDVTGTLRHVGGVPGVAWHFASGGWDARETPAGEREVWHDWCELVLAEGDGDAVLVMGWVEPDRFDDLAAKLRSTGATVSLELYDDGGRVVARNSVTREEVDAANRARYERDLATLVGRRVLDVTYWHLAYEEPYEPSWDHGDWHHAEMAVELTTDGGAVWVAWTNEFGLAYGIGTFPDLSLDPGGTRGRPAGDHDLWRARRGPVTGVATCWEQQAAGPSTTSDGTVPTPALTYVVPYAIRLDFDAGPVWFVAANPDLEDGEKPPFVGGDEVMVVFAAERMRRIGFEDGTY